MLPVAQSGVFGALRVLKGVDTATTKDPPFAKGAKTGASGEGVTGMREGHARRKEEARAGIALAPHFHASCLLSASGTGRTTLGGRAAPSVGCLYRACQAECDYGYQQNCSDALHDFLLLE
jgi:hypothetical protein